MTGLRTVQGSWIGSLLFLLAISMISVTMAASETVESDELDGGFSSLDGMLQWAIGPILIPHPLFFSVF